jgi:hypothetical protein
MNAAQVRKNARLFVREVMTLLPAEYHRELTEQVIKQEQRLNTLENQLMKRDGYVIHSTGEE